MQDLYLIADGGGTTFAIPATEIETVVRDMEIVPVPLADHSVAGIAALRSRVVTIVDLMAAIDGTTAAECNQKPIVVCRIEGHSYGFAVDNVRDITSAKGAPKPVAAALGHGWCGISPGYIETEAGGIIVIELGRLVQRRAQAA